MSVITIKGMIDPDGLRPVLAQFESGEARVLVDQDDRSGFLLAHGEGVFRLTPLTAIHWMTFHPPEGEEGRILRIALASEEYLYELVNPISGKRVPRMYFVEEVEGWTIANDDLGL